MKSILTKYPEELVAEMDAAAVAAGQSRSDFIRDAIAARLSVRLDQGLPRATPNPKVRQVPVPATERSARPPEPVRAPSGKRHHPTCTCLVCQPPKDQKGGKQ